MTATPPPPLRKGLTATERQMRSPLNPFLLVTTTGRRGGSAQSGSQHLGVSKGEMVGCVNFFPGIFRHILIPRYILSTLCT